MKIVKLGLMRLNSSEASKLVESSIRLPPMGEVGGASDFKGKEAMQIMNEFYNSIGADIKQKQGLIRLAKKNRERLGFLA
ncbi:hypothetical protein J1N35_037349 [Gossypium stocksii]|uniref:Uncharacterized protein n=1 Tax=Gossypium stocksii TaxID=47602 RepID=A0A9D3ZLS6_9ROSI|nr:hypothetical protein J1N35_037349 [Gossypium stocksii]